MALSGKQKSFVEHYVTHWNATKAAIDAGYSKKTAGQIGYENLKKPEVIAEIEARVRAIMPAGEVVQRLAARGRSSIADVLRMPVPQKRADGSEYTNTGDWSLDLLKAERTGAIHQIKKLKEGKYGTEIEMFDARPALEFLGKYQKLLGDDDGILKYIDLTKLTPEQLQRIADGENILAVILSTTANPSESPA